MRRGGLGWLIVGIGLAVLAVVPLVVTDVVYLHIFILIFLFAAWPRLGLVALAGQLSLGHSAFLGIGAYTSTLLFMGSGSWLGCGGPPAGAGVRSSSAGPPSACAGPTSR
jgi:branched-chain amino acid transport system permease protein